MNVVTHYNERYVMLCYVMWFFSLIGRCRYVRKVALLDGKYSHEVVSVIVL